jgi:sigma-B regulation protein RsbU (phosphoserine phosphatase)
VDRGDLFFFFTDGVTEAMDGAGDCFGDTRVVAFLERYAGHAPETIRDALVDEIAAFVQGQPQHDDITMIVLRVDG